jgi:hypothetical protein
MATALLIIWAVIGPSVGLVLGAWWCSRVRDDEAAEFRPAPPRRIAQMARGTLEWR